MDGTEQWKWLGSWVQRYHLPHICKQFRPDPELNKVHVPGVQHLDSKALWRQHFQIPRSLRPMLVGPGAVDLLQFDSTKSVAEHPSVPHLRTFIFPRFYNGYCPRVPGADTPSTSLRSTSLLSRNFRCPTFRSQQFAKSKLSEPIPTSVLVHVFLSVVVKSCAG